MKKIPILAVLILGCVLVQAKEVPGYIITLNNDTVKGMVVVPTMVGLKVYTKGFDIVGMATGIKFIDSLGKKKWKFTEHMNGFGFECEGVSYVFKKFSIETQPFLQQKKPREYFFHEVVNGKVSAYILYGSVQSYQGGVGYTGSSSTSSLYAMTSDSGLVLVEPRGKNQSLKDYMKDVLKLDAAFTDNLPNDLPFRAAVETFERYNAAYK